MKSLTFLGIGSNSLGSLNTSAFAIELTSSCWMLVDCGPDTPRQLGSAGIPLLGIEYLLITHRHLDHCLGLPYFLFGRNLERIARKREENGYTAPPLTIVAEREVWAALWDLFRLANPDTETLGFDIHFVDVTSLLNECREIGGFDMQVCAMDHAVPAYGFVAWHSGEKMLAYSTDTLPVEGFLTLASGCQVLIQEAMVPGADAAFSASAKHSTAPQAGYAISRINPGKAFLIHLRPVYTNRKAEIEREAATNAGMPVRFPEEGEVINF
jgi:ribonuclease BN (tRNA processing enzyme)